MIQYLSKINDRNVHILFDGTLCIVKAIAPSFYAEYEGTCFYDSDELFNHLVTCEPWIGLPPNEQRRKVESYIEKIEKSIIRIDIDIK